MRVLLLGEYSNVHNNLANGLRQLGCDVTVANDGDHWKKFNSDINLARRIYPGGGIFARIGNVLSGILFVMRLAMALLRMRGYDVVQVINPIFLPLKAERHFSIYRYLRRHNKKMVLCGMGDDYYYCYVNRTLKPMRYSDYNIGKEEHWTDFGRWTYADKVETEKGRLCRYIASDCDVIIAGAYEYWLPYHLTEDRDSEGKPLREKLHHIPFPFNLNDVAINKQSESEYPIRVFIGVSNGRSEFKGTDVMLQVARDLKEKYPDKIDLKVAEGVPFAEYQDMLNASDIMLDQIYSYGPGMNALLAMAKGMVTLTGGEPEHYDILGETECRPIVNVEPSYEDVSRKLEYLILHPDELKKKRKECREYVARNHDCIKVAEKYRELYKMG